MIIKKHNNKNDYLLSKYGYWVRDFTKPVIKPCDINDMMATNEDVRIIIENEFRNSLKKYQILEDDKIHENIVIIGDGYKFNESLKLIESLPPDVTIIGVNGAFAKWNIDRRLNYYVVNNPYQECVYYYPQIIKMWPRCIASTRTNPNFLEVYRGVLYLYSPVNSEAYSGVDNQNTFYIDDYRNPVCAAINLSYKFNVKNLMLMSTLEMYEVERPGCDQVKNNLWIYPQQKTAQDLINTNLYWLKKAKINIGYTDSNPDHEFATYISIDNLKRFFNDEQK